MEGHSRKLLVSCPWLEEDPKVGGNLENFSKVRDKFGFKVLVLRLGVTDFTEADPHPLVVEELRLHLLDEVLG
jgi:hypothetical protein